METTESLRLRACHCCGLIQRLPPAPHDGRFACVRCRAVLPEAAGCRRAADQRTAAASLAALCLYLPAVTLPILQVERLGHRHVSSLLSGTWELLWSPSWYIGLVVLAFSIVLPLAKILLLLELSLLEMTQARHRAITYRLVEHLGKWGMLDVLLLALLVMLIKVGSLVEFQLGPAVWAFVLCVLMSMVASASFDPHSIWNDKK